MSKVIDFARYRRSHPRVVSDAEWAVLRLRTVLGEKDWGLFRELLHELGLEVVYKEEADDALDEI